ncbi:protein obstructor-E-like [Culicoides brevitarsis]|uniref:protein obstructor-E-like n=1 Tax=Culicoides brevitarsis TaxID=469753 RepID=UPI00307C8166
MALINKLKYIILACFVYEIYTQSCPEKNGRFADPSQCDKYIECNDGVPEEKTCPDGLFFNDKAQWFNYPCGYPVDVDCGSRARFQPPQATEECPHQFGYYKIGDRANCGQWMNCVNGKSFVFECPEGLAWSSETYRCDWPDEVEDCDAEAYLGFKCPPLVNPEFQPQENRYYPHPTDCHKYFLCVGTSPRLFNCGIEGAYDESIYACNGVENVTTCH